MEWRASESGKLRQRQFVNFSIQLGPENCAIICRLISNFTLVQIQPYVPTKRVSSLTYKNNEVPGKLLLKPEYFKQMKDDYKLSSSIVHEEELIVLDNDRRVSPGNKFSFVTDENGRPLLAGGALKSDFPNQRKEVEFHGAEGKNTVNLAITVQNYVLSKGYPANSYVVVEVVPKRPPVFR